MIMLVTAALWIVIAACAGLAVGIYIGRRQRW